MASTLDGGLQYKWGIAAAIRPGVAGGGARPLADAPPPLGSRHPITTSSPARSLSTTRVASGSEHDLQEMNGLVQGSAITSMTAQPLVACDRTDQSLLKPRRVAIPIIASSNDSTC